MIIEVSTCPKCGVATESWLPEPRIAEDGRAWSGGERVLRLHFEEACWPCGGPEVWPVAAEDDDDLKDDLPF